MSTNRPPPPTSGAAAESWTATEADVVAWLRTARPGERMVYGRGPVLIRGAAAALVGRLTNGHVVNPHTRRDPLTGLLEYFIVKCRAPLPQRAPVCSPEMMAVLVVLQEAAQNRRRCPSDADIGAAVGSNADRVKWQLKKLKRSGFITMRIVPAPGSPKFRVVKIVATGMETAPPAGFGQ